MVAISIPPHEPPAFKPLIEVLPDGIMRVNFHPGQAKAWASERRFVAVIAGTQGGKTSFGSIWLEREIAMNGSGDYIAATATYDLFKLKMLPAMREYFEHTLGIARYWSGDKILEIRDPESGKFLAQRADDPMYARIVLRSAQAGGGLESLTAKAAWLDEAGQDEFRLDSWEAVIRRLSLWRGRVLITTTPYNLGWLKQEVVDPYERGDQSIEVITFPSIDNPAFSKEEFEERRLKMQDWKFKMFYRGIMGRPAGMIYNDFVDAYKDEGGHKVKPFVLPAAWARYAGVDPGAVNLAVLWFAHDVENDVYYLYRESLGGDKALSEHSKDLQALADKGNERVIRWFMGNKGEEQQRRDWRRGVNAPVSEPYFADVESGIDKVVELLRAHRLYIFDTCKGTLEQLATYRRKLNEVDEPIEQIYQKERYHYLDALRYFAVGRSRQITIDVRTLD